MHTEERSHFGATGDFMTVRHLILRGTNAEIGRAVAEIAQRRHGASLEDLRADPVFVRARRDFLRGVYPLHWQRVRGVAEAFGVDPDGDEYDLTTLTYNMTVPAMGCSVVYYPPAATTTDGGLLSRNYDFPTTSVAEILGVPLAPEVRRQLPPAMSEPYVMEWYPEDGGYASLAVQAFDPLSGTLDGINSAGLVVSIMADEEALGALGPLFEPHSGPARAVGLHELQVMRWLLDTCATAEQARHALLGVKQYYMMVPCHYLVADRAGSSFVYENSAGRNAQHLIEGRGQPQIATNFELYRHPTPETMPDGPPSPQTNAFWRYRLLADLLAAHRGPFSIADASQASACVNVQRVLDAAHDTAGAGVAAAISSRTLWHALYDQEQLTADISFYLGEAAPEDGHRSERRSPYLHFALAG